MTNLTKSQSAAIEYFSNYARSRKLVANQTIDHILKMSNVNKEEFQLSIQNIKKNAQVAIHFHPDRLGPNGMTVAEALLLQGKCRNQFETGLSNGSVSAHPGGDRDLWEKNLYGGTYHESDAHPSERPKYGALHLMKYPDGPVPSFGSCHLLLKPEVTRRCTFTYLDSHRNPPERGTWEEFDDIISAVLMEVFIRDFALGEFPITVRGIIEYLSKLDTNWKDPSDLPAKRNFHHYIEAQIHGDIKLDQDVARLVADPSFKGSKIERILLDISSQNQIELVWHCGFALPLQEVPDDFRGPTMPALAKRVATKNYLDCQMIGLAASSLKDNPEIWSDLGTPKEVLQELKMLWHVLAKYGKPFSSIKV